MDATQQQDSKDDEFAGDLLVGADAIRAFLAFLGMEGADPYYLRRSGWPIGSTSPRGGGRLIASKRRLTKHTDRITRGVTAA